MNIWEHCLISQRKFGGKPQDYEKVHSFMDSSKYFYYHAKHRLLLHHLLGAEWAVLLMGNFIENSEGNIVLVRDIAVEHCREDLDGKIPTLYDWLEEQPILNDYFETLPLIEDPILYDWVYAPFRRTGLKSSFVLTWSDFGVHLANLLLGNAAATQLAQFIPTENKIKQLLEHYTLRHRWQYTPQQKEIIWLREQKRG